MSKKNEIVKNESNGALVVDERPAWLDADSHRGSEDVGVKDIILPRIDVLQALSPQIKRNDPKRIEGAEQGMIFNTVSGELYDSEVNIVPIKFTREFIVWKDRDSGGGFAACTACRPPRSAARRASTGRSISARSGTCRRSCTTRVWPPTTPSPPV